MVTRSKQNEIHSYGIIQRQYLDKFDKVKIVPVVSYDEYIIARRAKQYGDPSKIYACNQHGNNYSNRLIAIYNGEHFLYLWQQI